MKLLLRAKHSSGKLARWCETVAEYDLEVKYRPGRKNANADALLRSPLETYVPGEESDSPTTQVAAVSSDLPEEVPLNVERLQAEDSELGPVFAFVETSSPITSRWLTNSLWNGTNMSWWMGCFIELTMEGEVAPVCSHRNVRVTDE